MRRSDTSDEVVFRKRYLSIMACGTGLIGVGGLIFLPIATADFRGMGWSLVFAVFLAVYVYLMWLLGWQSAVRLRCDGVVVDNLILRHEIPWSDFAEFSVEYGLVIKLRDGREVGSTVFGGSVIGEILRYKYTRRMCHLMRVTERALRAEDGTPLPSGGIAGTYRTRLNVRPVPLVAWLVTVEATTAALVLLT